jgi:aspartate kinase
MQVFKFGGASVKNSKEVINVAKLLNDVGYENTLIVVSAMGKTTNDLELIVKSYFKDKVNLKQYIENVKLFHNSILLDLFIDLEHPIYENVKILFNELENFLIINKSPNYSFVYDQVVGYGELISTSIIAAYLKDTGISNTWLDVRSIIKTDHSYRDAKVNWEHTRKNIQEQINDSSLYITQGFLGSDSNNFTTTLGREGSDYSAAIFAYCLNAKSVTIWKDVPGVLSADPKIFSDTKLLNQISYEEAIELAFYGASVIHPKTLQPLQRKEIKLFVKSFLNPLDKGTCVSKGTQLEPFVPCFIVKKNQILISLSSLDFSFIVEENISEIFALLHLYKLKVDVIQNSAISFSICVNDIHNNIEFVLQDLRSKFKVSSNKNVSLFTIRHFTDEALKIISLGKKVLLKQEKDNTVQLITSN